MRKQETNRRPYNGEVWELDKTRFKTYKQLLIHNTLFGLMVFSFLAFVYWLVYYFFSFVVLYTGYFSWSFCFDILRKLLINKKVILLVPVCFIIFLLGFHSAAKTSISFPIRFLSLYTFQQILFNSNYFQRNCSFK